MLARVSAVWAREGRGGVKLGAEKRGSLLFGLRGEEG